MAGSYVMGGIGFDKDLLFLQDPLCNPPVLIVVYVFLLLANMLPVSLYDFGRYCLFNRAL